MIKTFSNIEDENNIISHVNSTYADMSFDYSFPKEKMLMVMDNFNMRLSFPPLTKENFEKAKQEIKNTY